jgi:hypothetical protein
MGPHRLDLASLVAGCATTVLGVLLLLDRLGVLNLSLAYFAPAVAAAIGVILIARGWHDAPRG